MAARADLRPCQRDGELGGTRVAGQEVGNGGRERRNGTVHRPGRRAVELHRHAPGLGAGQADVAERAAAAPLHRQVHPELRLRGDRDAPVALLGDERLDRVEATVRVRRVDDDLVGRRPWQQRHLVQAGVGGQQQRAVAVAVDPGDVGDAGLQLGDPAPALAEVG